VTRVALLLAALAAGCGAEDPDLAVLRRDAGLPAPIVLVVIDTLRADHTAPHGYSRDTTPWLAEVAQHAFVFERAYANASWTRPSMATLFTSRLPESHGCEGRDGRLVPAIETLPELLTARGWDTRAVVANPNLAPIFGFGQGWTEYRCVPGPPSAPYANAADITPSVRQAIARLSAPPFLLYVHLVDPHAPWLLHPDYDFDPGYTGTFDGSAAALEPYRQRAPPPAERDRAIALYDSQIAFADAHIRQQLKPLKDSGLLDASWLVVTSDHGEGLWDHVVQGHEEEVFESQLRVPLLIRPPGGLPQTRRISETIALIDLAPTLLELVGVPPCAGFDGRSWAPLLLGTGPAPERPIIVNERVDEVDLLAVIDGRRKLIVDGVTGRALFYDLVTNPNELEALAHDLAGDPVPPALEARGLLERAMAAARAERPPDTRVKPDAVPADVLEQLRALGCVGGR
jgi:arylsulfatase A-like enzyme